MATPHTPSANPPSDAAVLNDPQVWESLKLAISDSSGFKRWQLDRTTDEPNLDVLVHQYLRETLETLAY